MTNIALFWIAISRNRNLTVGLSLLMICAAAVFADVMSQRAIIKNIRADTIQELSLVRARLEGKLLSNVQLVRGLVHTIKTEPNMDQKRFAMLAAQVFQEDSLVKVVAAAPNLVNSLVYPLSKYRKILGMDYRKQPEHLDAALHARELGKVVMAGPTKLSIGGGHGIIARFPIFINSGEKKSFWGIVSAVLNAEELYRQGGLEQAELPISVAIVGVDGKGTDGNQFYGPSSVLDANPVFADVNLPHGSWRLFAVPKAGWTVPTVTQWYERLIILATGVLLFIPIVVVSRFADQKRQNFEEISLRESELQKVSTRLKLALDTSQIGVWEFDFQSDHLFWDARMNELYGLPSDSGKRIYEDWEAALHPDDLERARNEFDSVLEGNDQYRSEFRVVMKSGEIRNIRAIGTTYEDGHGHQKIVGVNWDVTTDVSRSNDLEVRNEQLRTVQSQVEHLALHDPLTNLPNRRFLERVLALTDRQGQNGVAHMTIFAIDLDRFKAINDTLGHATGDALLVHVSTILKNCVRDEDFVARVGGDEFVVLCEKEQNPDRLEQIASSIIAKLSEPFVHEDQECRVGVSIGIATRDSHDIESGQLLVNADLALYQAKGRGRDRFEFFTSDLQQQSTETKQLGDEVLAGLERGEFVPYYQPQFDAVSHRLTGVEALARWNHPTQGTLTPDKFLGIAERLGVTADIDQCMLMNTLNDVENWTRLGLEITSASVNVSQQRLYDQELVNKLDQMDIKPGVLSFELVESIFLDEDDDVVRRNIDAIKNMGINVELDDFGTGHTSLVSLLKINPKRLKIDRQLVKPSTTDDGCRQMVKSIVEIARSLDIEVIAEGVETRQHAFLMRDLGCDILQGYAFAKPMSADELEMFAQRGLKMAS